MGGSKRTSGGVPFELRSNRAGEGGRRGVGSLGKRQGDKKALGVLEEQEETITAGAS